MFNGRITDEQNAPLSSVSIRLQKNGIGTISNQAGFFKLNVPQAFLEDTVLFSSIGYVSKKIALNQFSSDKQNVILLNRMTQILEEVVGKPTNPISIIQPALHRSAFCSPYC